MSHHATATRPPGPTQRVMTRLSDDTTSGLLLLLGAVIALVWANSPWRDAYADLSELTVGPHALHLDLSLATWAADGLLAIFFFTVGLELKREIVAGSLRDPRRAAMPALAAVGGMVMPAVFFAAVILSSDRSSAISGWAIPTATDIAFATAVLAVVGKGLPASVRTFLLTLAVVDDLLAITVIAVFYTDHLAIGWLAAAVVPLAVFAWLVRRRPTTTGGRTLLVVVAVVVAVVAWAFVHSSGIHATIAGVLLGFTAPARPREGEHESVTERLEHAVQPLSNGVALPLFAFFAAGVSLVDAGGLGQVLTQPLAVGVMLGLVGGKLIGVLGTVTLLERFTPLRLAEDQAPRDLLGAAMLAGIGFTVSLLIAELAYPAGEDQDVAKVAVLLGSVISALLASVALVRQKRRLAREGTLDAV